MNDLLLRRALLGNAAFSLVCAIPLIAFPGAAAAWLGAVPEWICVGLGAGLLIFAADLAWTATRTRVPLGIAKLITAADVAWVVATPIAMVFGREWLSPLGFDILIAVGLGVALCAGFQWRGIARAAS